MMTEKVKEIIAVYIKVPADLIGPDTNISRSALRNSILLHRMYARLAEEGLIVENYVDIKVFADLSASSSNGAGTAGSGQAPLPGRTDLPAPGHNDHFVAGLGIDIEEISAMPVTHDFRKEEFYHMNFNANEIAYCILQADPYSSFAGLFAVKEAIVKADGQYRNRAFNTIEVGHSAEGKPLYPGFSISISHAGGVAVAIASRSGTGLAHPPEIVPPVRPGSPSGQRARPAAWAAWIALLLSAMALLIVLMR
jgi:phosphopantetheine--protein transferase-like protein